MLLLLIYKMFNVQPQSSHQSQCSISIKSPHNHSSTMGADSSGWICGDWKSLKSPAARLLPQAHLNGMLPDWDQWVWSGSVPLGLCGQCHQKAEPYGHLCSGVNLTQSVDGGSICKQNPQFALCSFVDQLTMPAVHVVFPPNMWFSCSQPVLPY